MTTERKKEGARDLYGCGMDSIVHQIHFDGSYRSMLSHSDLDFWLCSAIQTVSTLAEPVCRRACVFIA